jgi:predicted lactoylglutathione lyase
VLDLQRSLAFFRALGFALDARFTDDYAACLRLSECGFVMLLERRYFRRFTPRALCDSATHVEALVAVSCVARAEVDTLAERALSLGGRGALPTQDRGFMYGRSFCDLDDHQWELVWIDPQHLAGYTSNASGAAH